MLLLLLLLRPRLLPLTSSLMRMLRPLTLVLLLMPMLIRETVVLVVSNSLIWAHLITQPWLIRPVTRERQRRPTTHRCAHRGSAFSPLLGVGIS